MFEGSTLCVFPFAAGSRGSEEVAVNVSASDSIDHSAWDCSAALRRLSALITTAEVGGSRLRRLAAAARLAAAEAKYVHNDTFKGHFAAASRRFAADAAKWKR